MIFNFWLVIIGLSLVSMLINVIQIKIEEWLYKMMKMMQVTEQIGYHFCRVFSANEYRTFFPINDEFGFELEVNVNYDTF